MAFISDSHAEKIGVTLEEKAQTQVFRQTRARAEATQGLPQVVVDRVSISHGRTMAYQSHYSFSMTGRSQVMSKATGETVSYEQKASMERLIGGVMDKAVIIKSIQGKKDMVLSKANALLPEDSASQKTGREIHSTAMWEISVKKTKLHFEEQRVNFQSSGEVITEDERVITFSLDMTLDRAFFSRTQEQTLVQKWQDRVNLTDPLVISLNGKAPQLTDATFEFDLNNDGKTENIGFVSPGSGFLAFDKNKDHIINNGSELFGPGTGNGFLELSAFDKDRNNWIDENDDVFSQLSVWTKDEKGQDHLISLKDSGLGAISLQNAATGFDMTKADNELQGRLKNTGIFLFENGKAGAVLEMDLALQAPDPIEAGQGKISRTDIPSPIRSGLPSFNFALVNVKGMLPEETQNPLKDLLDRIEKLKEQMAQLLSQSRWVG